jgi:tetratricopeptide (TPR) repeat protein
MKEFKFILVFGIILMFGQIGLAQEPDSKGISSKTNEVASNSNQKTLQNMQVSREKREQAYAKLLEGQRYIWSMSRVGSPTVLRTGARLAKESLQQAVELDPNLSEGYTALAELSYFIRPQDIDESTRLAAIATKTNPDNFGGHQILAKIYTEKSKINRGILDSENSQKAISEWKEVIRLDPRNAEGYAFLSAFYGQTGKTKEQIEALKNWISSATPIDTRFYLQMMGRDEDLSPESAMVKLGAVFVKEKSNDEAVEILSRAISDNPNNEEAILLLSDALENAGIGTITKTIEALQQAVFANPDNEALISMLARVQARSGDLDSATKILRDSILKFNDYDKSAAANLQIVLGDIYQIVNRHEEAAANYKTALAIRGIETNELIRDEDRQFAMQVYEKLIQTYKNANRPADVKDVISKARILFGDKNLFSDKL